MEKKKQLNVLVAIFSLAIVGGLSYLAVTNKKQTRFSEEVLAKLRCGDREYFIEDKKLEDISIVRIIENIGQDESNGMCIKINSTPYPNSVIGIEKKSEEETSVYRVVLYRRDNAREKDDPFNQSLLQFKFDLNKREIYFQRQFDGSFYQVGMFFR